MGIESGTFNIIGAKINVIESRIIARKGHLIQTGRTVAVRKEFF